MKMPDETILPFHFLCHNIEDLFSHFSFRLKECNNLFTFIRIDPNTFLQLKETKFCNTFSELVAKPFLFFFNVKNNYPPFFVPLPGYRQFFPSHLILEEFFLPLFR